MKINRIISGLLACAVIGGVLPFTSGVTDNSAMTVSAALGTYESLEYINYGDYIEISGFDQSVAEVVIPSKIEGLPVTSIGNYAFYNCSGLTSIEIPDGVTSIGNYAFDSCSSLTSITIPDSVTSIGDDAFYYCYSLTSITIPDGVTSIGDSTFFLCYGLTSVEIPDSVTSIGAFAFDGFSGLTSLTIPDSVTSIGDYAFNYCTGLTSITIPDSVTSIGDCAFYECKKLTSITINNPECEICDDGSTFTNDADSMLTATIYGYKNSTAQAYAEKYGRNFKILSEATEPTLSGDADLDGKVGISDVVKVMMYVSNKEANPLSEQGLINADVYSNGDGVFISDALSIQKKVAQIIDTLPEN